MWRAVYGFSRIDQLDSLCTSSPRVQVTDFMEAQRPGPEGFVCPNCGFWIGEAHRPDVRLLEEQIAGLRVENAQLREAGKAFGELAERLSELLRENGRH